MKNFLKNITIVSMCLVYGMPAAWAQSKTYRSAIEMVPESNYYNIEISQEMIGSSSSTDFSDLRIINGKGEEVPYFVRSENPIREISSFVSFPLVVNSHKDSVNTLIIENRDKQTLERFYIILRRADVNKTIRIRGSEDRKQWYIVRQNDDITYAGSFKDENEMLVVDFPKGNYMYYEITITNNQNSPLDILNVVRIENSNLFAQLIEIDPGRMTRKDSTDKVTYISFPDMLQTYRISKMEFLIGGKAYYLRNGWIKPGRERFTIASDFTNQIYLNSLPVNNETFICIDNRDNPPLTIESIRMYSLNRFLCAFLEAGDSYTLTIESGNYKPRPQYDIEHFRSKIPDDIPFLTCAPMEITSVTVFEEERKMLWIEKPVVLWSIIVVVGLFLTGICFLLLRDMKKKEK